MEKQQWNWLRLKKPILAENLQTSPFIALVPKPPHDRLHSLLTGEFYDIDQPVIKALEYCKYPRDTRHLNGKFGSRMIGKMAQRGFLLDPALIWDTTHIEYLEIETSTHCNWRCGYCPVHDDPKPKDFMTIDLFAEIIDKAARLPSLKFVTLNFYNEPTLDKYFEARIQKLAGTGLKLILSTNGSGLDPEKISLLRESGVLSVVRFNLPSIAETEFTRLTGSSQYEQTIKNIMNAVVGGLKVQIVVNGAPREIRENIGAIREKFGNASLVQVIQNEINDRAGLVKEKYAMNIHIRGAFGGCPQVTNWIHLGVHGEFFICSMDYYKNQVYGNIKDGEIADIVKNDQARLIRKRVFGAVAAPEDYLCRKCMDMKLIKALYGHSESFRPVFE